MSDVTVDAGRDVPWPGGDALGLQLLGGFALHSMGEVLDVPLSSQRVAAFVALQDGPVMRQRVAGSLWLDKSEHRATANLRSALWRLTACGAEVVISRGCHLMLAANVRVDLHELDRMAHPARTGIGPHGGGLLSLAEFDLLPDWYDDWVVLERERVRQRGLHALESLCLALAAAGEYARSIDVGLRVVAADPLRESAQRAVITAHLAEGNRGEALRQFESYRVLVKAELGVDPSRAMVDLLDGTRLRSA